MKIQSGISSIAGSIKTNITEGIKFEKGRIVTGEIMSMKGSEFDIVLSPGLRTRATTQGLFNLPLNTSITFEVLESNGDTLLLKPVIEKEAVTVSKERLLVGFASELGIKPSPDNVSFLNNYKTTLSKGIEQLISLLRESDNMPAVHKLQEIFIGPDKIVEYIKGFNEDSMEKLINQINELCGKLKDSGSNAKMYTRLLGDIAKSFFVQVNHELPLFFIPIPLMFNNSFYPGEIWIEKDADKAKQDSEQISIYIFVDTPRCGRIEASINGTEKNINIDLYCKNEFLPLFEENLNKLRQQLSVLSVNVNSINVHELKHSRSFADLVPKYIKPFPAVDIKI